MRRANGDNEVILEVKKLEVTYNHVATAIQGVSFKIPKGDIFTIIGGNGAGKTTTLRAISGFLSSENAEITDGEIIFKGEKINNRAPHKITRRGIAIIPERYKVFETLKTEENLTMPVSRGSAGRKNKKLLAYEYFPRLYELRGTLAAYLSGGERQMLAVGQALLCSPELLMVDELSLGLAPAILADLIKTLQKINKETGLTILLVEQNVAASLDIADYAAVMENGRIVFDGPPQKLMAHEDVREFYLGLHATGEKSYRDVKQYRRTRRWWG